MNGTKYVCGTCWDFAVKGETDSVDDIGLHVEWKSVVDCALSPDEYVDSGRVVNSALGFCDLCGIDAVKLHRFTKIPAREGQV